MTSYMFQYVLEKNHIDVGCKFSVQLSVIN